MFLYVCVCVCMCVYVCVFVCMYVCYKCFNTHALLKLCYVPSQLVDSYYYLHYNRLNYIDYTDEN